MPAIEAEALVKIYHENSAHPVRALDELSLQVRQGEIFGLLGQNGAGKTTFLRVLTTLTRATAGHARLLGLDVARKGLEVRQRICAVLQENAVELFLSVEDNLQTYGRFHSLRRGEISRRSDQVIEQFGLGSNRKQKVIDLSGGLKRRLQVAKVLMVDKPVVFLDEATTGMDPISKRATLDTLREQARQGRTILLTTHILEEAEELCDRIAIIDRGRLVAVGDPNSIKSYGSAAVDIRVTYGALPQEAIARLSRFPHTRLEQRHTTLEICIDANRVSPFDVLAEIAKIGSVVSFEVSSGTLEDAFVELLGKGRRERSGDQ
ncbi:MAG TPA: ABC transporter ATP-binding protein [Bacteroidota bacterium]|nr:ABC transporter ATP-binding protein [Bacteroidota bacterium]